MSFSSLFWLVLWPCISPLRKSLGLGARLLLIGNRPAARSLARARISVRALAPDRQTAAMTQAAISAHLDQPLHIHRVFFAEIAFYRSFRLQNLPDAVHFVFGEVGDPFARVHSGPVKQ